MADPQLEETKTVSHEYLEHKPSGWFESTLTRVSSSTDDFLKKNGRSLHIVLYFLLHGALVGYFLGCFYYHITYMDEPLMLCSGFGSLVTVVSRLYLFLFYVFVVKRYFGAWLKTNILNKAEKTWAKLCQYTWFRWLAPTLVVAPIVTFLVVDTLGASERLISLLGIAVIMGLGFIFSAHPTRINWHSVLSGLLLQFIIGMLLIRSPSGRRAMQSSARCLSDLVAIFFGYGVDGAEFAFGEILVRTEGVFAFSVLPVVFFFSMLVEILFFWGILQWLYNELGELLHVVTATTVCESVSAVGNIFLGQAESILLIKPYIYLLTPSELHVVMSSSFATVSGTILASYIGFGAEPAHLVTASIMSAPATACYAKLMLPETKRSLTSVDNIQPVVVQDQSALSAATRGATNGIALVLNIVSNIVAFVAFIAFINGVLGYMGGLLGAPDFSLEWLFGKIFIPLAWVMGVPWEECEVVGTLIGLKTVNEFVAYQRMGEMKAAGLLSPRAELIATYALCGFPNPGLAGIQIGAISAMAPNQRETVSDIVARAFFTRCGICFMTACIAGLLMPDGAFG